MMKVFSHTFRFWKLKFFLIVLSPLVVLTPFLGGTGLAYDRYKAVSYAERWALSRNSNYPNFGKDCTNFVSQALDAGGYRQVIGNASTTNDQYWWIQRQWWGGWANSHSWSVTPDQYQFQYLHYPGGTVVEVVNPNIGRYYDHYDNSRMIGGDELFYDWGGGKIEHMAFQVWSGYSQYMPSGQSWYGDLSDQHVNDRYHVSWNHIEVNAQWPTTVIYEEHIDSGN